MDQRATVFFIMVLLVVGILGVVVAGSRDSSKSTGASPTPSGDLHFITDSNNAQGASNLDPQGQQPAPQRKTYAKFPGVYSPADLKNKVATIQTDKGNITFEIYPEATKAASNFIFLAQDHFYDGLTFHRVEPGFVIQGGDPLGNGTGGPGYTFEDEPVTKQYLKGTVAMANAGPNTNGSQFFIMLDDHPDLPAKYTIFGQVVAGQDVVDKIAKGDVMRKVIIQNYNPSAQVGP